MLQKPTLRSTGIPLALAAIALLVLNMGLYTRLGANPVVKPLPFPYQEDFDNDDVLDRYARFSGTWDIRDESLVQLSTSGFDLIALIPIQVPIDQPYLYQTRMRFLGGQPGGGVLFNAQQVTTRQQSHMVRFNLDAGQLWLLFGYFGDDSNFVAQGSAPVDIDPNTEEWHTMAIRVENDVYSILVDDAVIVPDVPLQYLGGSVGVLTAESQVAFDDISAQPITLETPAVVEAIENTAPDTPADNPDEVTPVVEAPVLADGAVLWRDDFDGTDTDPGQSAWLPISGQWEFRSGVLAQTQTDVYDLLAINQQPVTGPYRFATTLQHEEGIGGGLMFNILQPDQRDGGHMVRYYEEGLVWGYFEVGGGFIGQGNAAVTAPADAVHTLAVTVTDSTFAIYVDQQLIAEDIPLMSDGQYLGLVSSISAVAFADAEVVGLGTEASTIDALDLNTISGQWVTEDGITRQLDQESVDYIAGTGVLAETFTVSVDILLPDEPEVADAGAGLVLHMAERENPASGSMVRFGSGGTEIFWGEFDENGIFQGLGGSPLALEVGVPHTLTVSVAGGNYDIYVDGTLLIQDVPMTTTQGWIGLLSFRGPTEFSNLQLTIGE